MFRRASLQFPVPALPQPTPQLTRLRPTAACCYLEGTSGAGLLPTGWSKRGISREATVRSATWRSGPTLDTRHTSTVHPLGQDEEATGKANYPPPTPLGKGYIYLSTLLFPTGFFHRGVGRGNMVRLLGGGSSSGRTTTTYQWPARWTSVADLLRDSNRMWNLCDQHYPNNLGLAL